MNHDEGHFRKKIERFSVAKKCPRCGQLSLSFKNNLLLCENCGYSEQIPTAR